MALAFPAMTIATLSDRLTLLSPVAGSTDLAYDFELTRPDGLAVIRKRGGATSTLALGLDYSFPSGLGTPAGGTLSLLVPSMDGDEYQLAGLHPEVRLSDFIASQAFQAAKFNADLDALTIVAQEHRRDIDRSLKIAFGEAAQVGIEPEPNHFIGWDATGTKLVNKGTPGELGAGDMLASNNLSDLDDISEARINLGIPDDLAAVATAMSALDNVKRDDLAGPTLAMPAIHIKSRVHDIFSVMEVFDTDTQRDEIRNRASALDAGPYINAATDYATRRGYGVVEFPFGTYLLKGARNGAYSRALILARSGLSLVGHEGSIIKIDDDLTVKADTTTIVGSIATYDYRIISISAEDASSYNSGQVDDFTVEGLSFDCNGANNTVAGSGSGGQIRRAYVVALPGGSRIKISRNKIKNSPGRNVLHFGTNTPDKFYDCEISYNRFNNVGDAISGNSGQNDHSTLYTQFNGGKVFGNWFWNDTAQSPTKNHLALEIHGSRTDVYDNRVWNYANGGNAVALGDVGGSVNNRWFDNDVRISAVGIAIWAFDTSGTWNPATESARGLQIIRNQIEINNTDFDNTAYGVYQHTATDRMQVEVEDLVVADNRISCTNSSGTTNLQHGIILSSLNGARIERNSVRNCSGAGVYLQIAATAGLGIQSVSVKGNRIRNCGIAAAASRPWGIYVLNSSTDHVFEGIDIDDNNIEAFLQPVGTAPVPSRGIRVTGPGYLRDVIVGPRNMFKNIQRAQRVEFTSTTENINVGRLPRSVPTTTQADPVSGHFESAGERTEYMNPSASNFIGRVPTTSGSASSATWQANTAYKPGQWIKLSDGKVIEYTVGGTSHATTEPTPATLMQQYTDGTATFAYRDSASAVFKTYGATSA